MSKKRSLPERICVLDLETSGSGPDSAVLEIGMVMLESDRLIELGRFQSLVLPNEDIDYLRDWGKDVVREMHDRNGLWDDLRAARGSGLPQADARSAPEVDEEASRWVRSINLDSTAHVALAGSGVSHFDRPFIRRDLPKLDRLFTYWALDVGVMRRILTLSGANFLQPTFDVGAAKTHRALDDALVHADELRHYVNTMRRLSALDAHLAKAGTP